MASTPFLFQSHLVTLINQGNRQHTLVNANTQPTAFLHPMYASTHPEMCLLVCLSVGCCGKKCTEHASMATAWITTVYSPIHPALDGPLAFCLVHPCRTHQVKRKPLSFWHCKTVFSAAKVLFNLCCYCWTCEWISEQ